MKNNDDEGVSKVIEEFLKKNEKIHKQQLVRLTSIAEIYAKQSWHKRFINLIWSIFKKNIKKDNLGILCKRFLLLLDEILEIEWKKKLVNGYRQTISENIVEYYTFIFAIIFEFRNLDLILDFKLYRMFWAKCITDQAFDKIRYEINSRHRFDLNKGFTAESMERINKKFTKRGLTQQQISRYLENNKVQTRDTVQQGNQPEKKNEEYSSDEDQVEDSLKKKIKIQPSYKFNRQPSPYMLNHQLNHLNDQYKYSQNIPSYNIVSGSYPNQYLPNYHAFPHMANNNSIQTSYINLPPMNHSIHPPNNLHILHQGINNVAPVNNTYHFNRSYSPHNSSIPISNNIVTNNLNAKSAYGSQMPQMHQNYMFSVPIAPINNNNSINSNIINQPQAYKAQSQITDLQNLKSNFYPNDYQQNRNVEKSKNNFQEYELKSSQKRSESQPRIQTFTAKNNGISQTQTRKRKLSANSGMSLNNSQIEQKQKLILKEMKKDMVECKQCGIQFCLKQNLQKHYKQHFFQSHRKYIQKQAQSQGGVQLNKKQKNKANLNFEPMCNAKEWESGNKQKGIQNSHFEISIANCFSKEKKMSQFNCFFCNQQLKIVWSQILQQWCLSECVKLYESKRLRICHIDCFNNFEKQNNFNMNE